MRCGRIGGETLPNGAEKKPTPAQGLSKFIGSRFRNSLLFKFTGMPDFGPFGRSLFHMGSYLRFKD